MINQNFIQSIQQTFNKTYNGKMVDRLQKAGHSDTNPFNGKIHLGLYIPDYTMRDVFLTVQTKKPDNVIGEYHVWVRPLSKEVYLGMPDNTFKHVDEVYALVNGSGMLLPATIIDDTKSW